MGVRKDLSAFGRETVRLDQLKAVAGAKARARDLAGVWTVEMSTGRVTSSEEVRLLYGLPVDSEPSYATLLGAVHAQDRPALERAISNALASRQQFSVDHRVVTSQGEVRWLRAQGLVVTDQHGGLHVVGLARDVSAEASVPLEVHVHDFVEGALDNLSDLVLACAEDGRVLFFNPAMERFLGIKRGGQRRVDLKRLGRMYRPDGHELTDEESLIQRTMRGDAVRDIEVVAVIDGRHRNLVVNGTRFVDDDGGRGVVMVLHDITEQRRAEEALRFNATHDALTGFPNHALFMERVAATLLRDRARDSATAILSLDIDHFEGVILEFGYPTADRVLLEVASRVERTLRSGWLAPRRAHAGRRRQDEVAVADERFVRAQAAMARVGGDEFLVLCDRVDGEPAAAAIIERIQAALSAPITVDSVSVSVTASAGIALARGPDVRADIVVAQAKAARRRARELGDGGWEIFTAGALSAETERTQYLLALTHAVANKELRLLFQPKVSLLDERMVGVEALVRWESPEHGLVAPLDFIPLAEQTGLIIPIGTWVLEEACRAAQRWRVRHPGGARLSVSVNVSARQFDTDLVATVAHALQRTGLDPATLCLEVTESTVMRDVDRAIVTLRGLRSLGVGISVDDFGTGYSSLAYLKRFPVTELKVDKTFIDGLGHEPDDTAIVAAVIASAHALNLTVVAEGVETAQHVTSLQTLGCELAQGYHYSRPVPAGVIDDILARGGRLGAPASPDERTLDRNEVALVVDDAADMRLLARMSLAAHGFEVHEAESGAGALSAAERVHPDYVVLDLNLPDVSGREVCRRLREQPANSQTTIVMLTADATPAEKAQAFTAGADDYIVKPFSPRELISRLVSAKQHRSELIDMAPSGGRPA